MCNTPSQSLASRWSTRQTSRCCHPCLAAQLCSRSRARVSSAANPTRWQIQFGGQRNATKSNSFTHIQYNIHSPSSATSRQLCTSANRIVPSSPSAAAICSEQDPCQHGLLDGMGRWERGSGNMGFGEGLPHCGIWQNHRGGLTELLDPGPRQTNASCLIERLGSGISIDRISSADCKFHMYSDLRVGCHTLNYIVRRHIGAGHRSYEPQKSVSSGGQF